eukprot:1448415-Lingulodinium_polyedra.AAC.1
MAPKAKRANAATEKRQARAMARAELGARSHRAMGVPPTEAYLHTSVGKILREKFAGWPQLLLDGVTIQGMTLVQRLTEDKRSWCITGCPSMGPQYFAKRREEYQETTPLGDRLRIDMDAAANQRELDKSLGTALTMARLQRPLRGALRVWLQEPTNPNQKETLNKCMFFLKKHK